ncbi:unnamed protein product [Bemisia tabaci]|uniref:C2H2-type domain-containing protein n=1 Tax=Bemisia tabaci TaxID=7038 RepID=A0A9P0F2Y9_BEMTA|nr:unnamed protein product [Bemisia tabaci]
MDGSQTLTFLIPEEEPQKPTILIPAEVSRSRRPVQYSIIKVQKQSSSAPPEEEHPCGKCGKKYRSHAALFNHMKMHTGATKCKTCRRTFATVDSLRRHVLFTHSVVKKKTESKGNEKE